MRWTKNIGAYHIAVYILLRDNVRTHLVASASEMYLDTPDNIIVFLFIWRSRVIITSCLYYRGNWLFTRRSDCDIVHTYVSQSPIKQCTLQETKHKSREHMFEDLFCVVLLRSMFRIHNEL